MLKFDELSLIRPLLTNLARLGYENPTAIQAQAIPLILNGQDVLGIAQTGTGKTAAFCLPILQRLAALPKDKKIKALVLAPTRELATQIHLSFEQYGQDLGFKSLAIFGGDDQKEQIKAVREGIDVLVATPGRLLDLWRQKQLPLGQIEVLVLDEADRMLDMGFLEDLQAIIEILPKERQTLFFSATMPDQVAALARRILYRPQRVEVSANSSTVSKIDQKIFLCKREDKFQLLRKILKSEERELVIVFTKTKNSADKIKEYLLFHRMAATVFHGDKSQADREKALFNFKNGSIKILIATDMAARGLDVSGISHVINFELPVEAESYVHRIGRTARAGKDGKAFSFCEESELPMLEKIQKLIETKLPSEKYKGSSEASGKWMQDGSIRKVKAPTPGKSQEKTAYLDHSKRQRIAEEGAPKPKAHPGFRKKKKKR